MSGLLEKAFSPDPPRRGNFPCCPLSASTLQRRKAEHELATGLNGHLAWELYLLIEFWPGLSSESGTSPRRGHPSMV